MPPKIDLLGEEGLEGSASVLLVVLPGAQILPEQVTKLVAGAAGLSASAVQIWITEEPQRGANFELTQEAASVNESTETPNKSATSEVEGSLAFQLEQLGIGQLLSSKVGSGIGLAAITLLLLSGLFILIRIAPRRRRIPVALRSKFNYSIS
jgi:hypothetical protein